MSERPVVLAAGIVAVACVIVLNVAAFGVEERVPWLLPVALIGDILAVGAGIAFAIWQGMRIEEASAHAAMQDARVNAIVDSAMDAIITIDRSQRIVLFNRAAESAFGCPRETAIGQTLDRFIPARFRARHRAHVESFGGTGNTTRRMGATPVLWALRADGEEFPIEASISQSGGTGERVFTVILRDVTQRAADEERLTRQQDELRELSARVLEAREEEKTLIARELHDELGQLLTALKMDLTWLRAHLPEERKDIADKAGQMNDLLDQTVGSVRRISADLRPLMLDDLGLADAAGWLVEDFARRAGIACRLDQSAEIDVDSVDRPCATAVYRALQESLTNIARHAQAKNAWVVLGVEDGVVHLEVEDDGRGIDPDDLARSRSLGLKGMRERAVYLGGTLEIARAPRGGTRVRLRVPQHSPHGERA